MSRRSWFRPIALLLLLVGAVGVGYLLFRPITLAAVGVAPEFRLSTTDGRHIALSDYHGRPVLLNFFASWCTTCREELAAIARARSTHPKLIALLIDEHETPVQVRAFLRGLHVSQTALLDANGSVAARYAISAQPVTVWITPSGYVRAVSRGPIDQWTIDARYSELTSNT